MYAYEWDSSTGGYILTPMPLAFSKEPRPVYYKELDILGFDKYWDYDKNDSFPYMWAEANNYYYRGRLVAKTKGGSLYTPPELVLIEDPEPEGYPLRFVDIPAMVDKNRQLMEQLVQETIKKIYNTFIEYQDKVDVFYVAFSGGKDSVVALDLVQRALPHNCFKVLFGDTGMEFPDTYETVEKIKQICAEEKIEFLQAKSKLKPENTWQIFGPPAVTIRWCCSVHKTTPQIMQLREVLQKPDFTGMAFTGVRGDESLSRSEYDAISYGGKHSGQYSCHPILEWNTAELFLYIYENGLTFNNAYKKGNTRAGCLVCPMSQGKHDYMKYKNYPDDTDLFINKIITTSGKNFSKENYDRFVEQGYWRTRKSGRELSFGHDKHVFEIVKGQNVITVQKKNEYWKEWAKTYEGYAIEVLSNWAKRIKCGDFYVYSRYATNGERVANIQDLFIYLLDIDKFHYPQCLEGAYTSVLNTMYDANSLGNGATCGINEETKGTFRSGNEATKLENALKGAWKVPEYWNNSHSYIADLKKL